MIPKNWNDISVGTFIEMFSFKPDEFATENEYLVQLYSVLCDEDPTAYEEMDMELFNELKYEFEYLSKLPNKGPKTSLIIENTELHLLPELNHITFGEFIDLENLITSNQIENLPMILAIMYRRLIVNDDVFIPDVIEPYGNYISHRSKLFNDVSIADVYGVLPMYIKFRTNIFEIYSGLFDNDTDEGEEVIDISEMSRAEKLDYQKKLEYDKTISKWNLEIMLLKLADNDITKVEKITELGLIHCLNSLAMRKELNITT